MSTTLRGRDDAASAKTAGCSLLPKATATRCRTSMHLMLLMHMETILHHSGCTKMCLYQILLHVRTHSVVQDIFHQSYVFTELYIIYMCVCVLRSVFAFLF